jgi:hypothetical protein
MFEIYYVVSGPQEVRCIKLVQSFHMMGHYLNKITVKSYFVTSCKAAICNTRPAGHSVWPTCVFMLHHRKGAHLSE